MQAIQVSSIEKQEFGATKVPLPEPKAGELLIRVEAAPINPSDQYMAVGQYCPDKIPSLPYKLGLEGAGIVTGVGEGVDKEAWLDKKVSFACNPFQANAPGSYSQFITLPVEYPTKVVMSPDVPCVEMASLWVNPMTVMGFYDIAKKAGVSAIAHNAGASALGKQLFRLGQLKGFEVVNVVRRAAQVDYLHSIGSKHVVNTSEEGWQAVFKETTEKLGATILFDAIGGDIASTFLGLMPYGSTLYNYGLLSGKPLSGFSGADFIFQQKGVKGFWLGPWMMSLKPLELKDYIGTVAADINAGGKIFGSKVAKTFTLGEIHEAIKYANANTLEGKVYMTPNA